MIAYQGCKRREIPDILKCLVPAKVFVDVFGGSGAVCYDLRIQSLYENIHYNDGDKMITELAKAYQADSFPLLDLVPTKENYETIRDRFTYESGTLAEYLWLKRQAFRGIINCKLQETKNGKTKDNRPFKKNVDINCIGEITNEDFKKILERYKDNSSALLYFDPPYCNLAIKNIDNTEYGGVDLDPNCLDILLDFAEECKCKIAINVPFDGYLYNRICNSKILKLVGNYPANYNIIRHKARVMYHCIICNYDKPPQDEKIKSKPLVRKPRVIAPNIP